MSLQRTAVLALTAAIATCIAGLSVVPAAAAPLADQASADRVALDQAVARYEEVQTLFTAVDARANEASARLDQFVAEESVLQDRLRSRVVTMYRTAEADRLSLLLSASSVQDLATRLDMLARLGRQDAGTIAALKAAQVEARRSAEELVDLQAEQARALDQVAEEVVRARQELAVSEAALQEYEARLAAIPKPVAPARPAPPASNDPGQGLTGTGDWQTAVASHYGRNFTGRGASGETIGPYSMIVAHKTLPFGTLIEFEYQGKRAVARVADRGPYTAGRTFDLGPGVVRVLDFSGVHEVRYRIISQ